MQGASKIKSKDPQKRVNPLQALVNPKEARAHVDAKIVDRMARSSPRTTRDIYRGQKSKTFSQRHSPSSWSTDPNMARFYAAEAKNRDLWGLHFKSDLQREKIQRVPAGKTRAWDLRATEATDLRGRGARAPWGHQEMIVPKARTKR